MGARSRPTGRSSSQTSRSYWKKKILSSVRSQKIKKPPIQNPSLQKNSLKTTEQLTNGLKVVLSSLQKKNNVILQTILKRSNELLGKEVKSLHENERMVSVLMVTFVWGMFSYIKVQLTKFTYGRSMVRGGSGSGSGGGGGGGGSGSGSGGGGGGGSGSGGGSGGGGGGRKGGGKGGGNFLLKLVQFILSFFAQHPGIFFTLINVLFSWQKNFVGIKSLPYLSSWHDRLSLVYLVTYMFTPPKYQPKFMKQIETGPVLFFQIMPKVWDLITKAWNDSYSEMCKKAWENSLRKHSVHLNQEEIEQVVNDCKQRLKNKCTKANPNKECTDARVLKEKVEQILRNVAKGESGESRTYWPYWVVMLLVLTITVIVYLLWKQNANGKNGGAIGSSNRQKCTGWEVDNTSRVDDVLLAISPVLNMLPTTKEHIFASTSTGTWEQRVHNFVNQFPEKEVMVCVHSDKSIKIFSGGENNRKSIVRLIMFEENGKIYFARKK
jgi:hypothetical protein